MEMYSRRRSRLVMAVAAATACYWLAMFVGTHWPLAPDLNKFPGFRDKLEHLSAFTGLAILLCIASAAWGIRLQRLALAVVAIVAVYGIFDEITQSLVPNREPDVRDWLADVLGALLGIAVFFACRRIFPPRCAAAP